MSARIIPFRPRSRVPATPPAVRFWTAWMQANLYLAASASALWSDMLANAARGCERK